MPTRSSVAPVAHDHYGWREAPRFAFKPLPWVRPDRDPGDHRDVRRQAAGGGRRRLLPRAALCLQPLGDPPGQPARRAPGGVLFPPVGDRPRPAARGRRAAQVEAAPLHQPRRDGAPSCASWSTSSPGAGWTCSRTARPARAATSRARHERAVRSLARNGPRSPTCAEPDEVARIEAFVAEHARQRRSTARPGCARSSAAPASARCGLVAERRGVLTGWLPLTEVHSPLFGRALAVERLRGRRRRAGRSAPTHRATLCARGRGTGAAPVVPDDRAARRRRCRDGWTVRTRQPLRLRRAAGGRRRGAACSRSRASSAPRCARGSSSDLDVSGRHAARHDRAAHYAVYAESVRNLGTPVFPARAVRCGARRVRRRCRHPDRAPSRARRSRACCRSTTAARCMPYWGGGTLAARAPARQRADVFRADAPRPRARLHALRFRPLEDRQRGLRTSRRTGASSPSRCAYASWTAPGAAPRDVDPTSARACRAGSRCGSACRCRSPTGSARRSRGGWDDGRDPVPRAPHPVPARPRRQDPLAPPAQGAGRSSRRSTSATSARPRPTAPTKPSWRPSRDPLPGRARASRCGRARLEALAARRAGEPDRVRRPRSLPTGSSDTLARAADRDDLRVLRPDGAIRARRLRRARLMVDLCRRRFGQVRGLRRDQRWPIALDRCARGDACCGARKRGWPRAPTARCW